MHNSVLESSFHAEESIVYSNFAETASSFSCITDMLQSPPVEHQAGSASMLTDEATPSADTELSGESGNRKLEEDLHMDKATIKDDIDGLPDCSGKLELAIVSDNSQISNGCHDIKGGKQDCSDDSEDLWHCGLERKSSFEAASVDKETAENADNNAFGEHNDTEVEYDHEIVSDNGSSMQPYVVHSHQQALLDQLHHISSAVPGDHGVKSEDDKQYSSTMGQSKSEGHPEQEMNKTEDSEASCIMENSAPGNGKVGSIGDQEENMFKLQQLLMCGLQDKEKVLLTEYTSILRNYKNAKRRLTEVETKNQECVDEMKAMLSELRRANEMKDDEIRSLRELLNCSTDKDATHNGQKMNKYTPLSFKSGNGTFRGHQRTPSFLPVHQRKHSATSTSRITMKSSSLKNSVSLESPSKDAGTDDAVLDSIDLGDLRLTNIIEMEMASPLEDKFRRDIDGLL